MSREKKIKIIESNLCYVLENLLDISEMIPGAYGSLLLRCGKKNCWCHKEDGGGHPLRRITWTENGVSRTKSIPTEDIEWIKRVTKDYKAFRKLRRKLKKIENDLKEVLDKHEKEVIKNTRKLRDYL